MRYRDRAMAESNDLNDSMLEGMKNASKILPDLVVQREVDRAVRAQLQALDAANVVGTTPTTYMKSVISAAAKYVKAKDIQAALTALRRLKPEVYSEVLPGLMEQDSEFAALAVLVADAIVEEKIVSVSYYHPRAGEVQPVSGQA